MTENEFVYKRKIKEPIYSIWKAGNKRARLVRVKSGSRLSEKLRRSAEELMLHHIASKNKN